MHVGDVFWLDWEEQQLFGWERRKSGIFIASIIEGIVHDDAFPAVPVHVDWNDPASIYLCTSSKVPSMDLLEGGHKRAMGHYLIDRPLKCKIVDFQAPAGIRYSIGDHTLMYSRDDTFYFEYCREKFSAYRQISEQTYRAFKRDFPGDRKLSALKKRSERALTEMVSAR